MTATSLSPHSTLNHESPSGISGVDDGASSAIKWTFELRIQHHLNLILVHPFSSPWSPQGHCVHNGQWYGKKGFISFQ